MQIPRHYHLLLFEDANTGTSNSALTCLSSHGALHTPTMPTNQNSGPDGPPVSVVIPCYRQAHWLSAAVNSCLNQTLQPIEILVVNDGSDDDTESVTRSFGDRIRYIWQPNLLQAVARNNGLRNSTGRFVLFLDADDALHPEAVSQLYAAANQNRPTVAAMGWRPFEDDPARPCGPDCLPPQKDLIKPISVSNLGSPPVFLSFCTTLMETGGFDPGLNGTSDWDCWLRLLFAGADLTTIPFVGAFYRQSPNQLSRNHLHMDEQRAFVANKLVKMSVGNPGRMLEWGLDTRSEIAELRRLAAHELLNAGYLRRKNGDLRRAAWHYWAAIRNGVWSAGVRGLLKPPVRAWVSVGVSTLTTK